MNKLRFAIAAAVALCLFAVTSAHAAADNEAGKYIQHVGDQALAVIANKNLNKNQKQAQLEKIFAGSVDIAWVGKFVMGRFWREATDDQKARYLKKYEKFLILHYTSRFSDYTGGGFKVTTSKPDGDNEFSVSMELKGDKPGDEPVLVDYRVRKGPGGFKIFDVIVEGVSLITTQRSEFSSVIGNHDINYLIDKLDSMSVANPDQKG